jgi:RNA-binding protein YlmH
MTKKANTTGLADELGIIRAKMADLKDREVEIREVMIAAGISAFEDKKFRAVVVESLRTMIDWKSVAAKLEPSHQLVSAHTTQKDVISIRVSARRGALLS